MKAHLLLVDGICLIDKMEFRAFNESTHLKLSSLTHRSVFGQLHQLGADSIYTTNANRRYLTEKQVLTCFPRKGPKLDSKPGKSSEALFPINGLLSWKEVLAHTKLFNGLDKIKAKGVKRERGYGCSLA